MGSHSLVPFDQNIPFEWEDVYQTVNNSIIFRYCMIRNFVIDVLILCQPAREVDLDSHALQ